MRSTSQPCSDVASVTNARSREIDNPLQLSILLSFSTSTYAVGPTRCYIHFLRCCYTRRRVALVPSYIWQVAHSRNSQLCILYVGRLVWLSKPNHANLPMAGWDTEINPSGENPPQKYTSHGNKPSRIKSSFT